MNFRKAAAAQTFPARLWDWSLRDLGTTDINLNPSNIRTLPRVSHAHCWQAISYAMSGQKSALKAISAAIKAQKYDDAVNEAQKLLANDPKSYQSSVPSIRTDPSAKRHYVERMRLILNQLSLLRLRPGQAGKTSGGGESLRNGHDYQTDRPPGMAGSYSVVRKAG